MSWHIHPARSLGESGGAETRGVFVLSASLRSLRLCVEFLFHRILRQATCQRWAE